MRLEKWGIFAIGLAVLIIASFSIVGSLIMLIIDKKEGIRTLGSLGAGKGMVRGIFIRQGMMIGTLGAAGGLVLGLAVCAVQQLFGVIPMPGTTFLVDSYPVLMRPGDIAAICAAFLTVNYLIVTFTVLKTIGKRDLGL
jgi:lipoprotein-releasing system permease protein